MIEEGDNCPEDACDGTMQFPEVEGCVCHLNPPCPYCVEVELECIRCGYEDSPIEREAVIRLQGREDGSQR